MVMGEAHREEEVWRPTKKPLGTWNEKCEKFAMGGFTFWE